MQFPLSSFWGRDAFKKAPYTKEDYCNGCHKLSLPVDQFIKVEDFDKVQAVGPFTAELYFVKNGKSDFAFIKDVPTRRRREFLQHFSGVKLYRDNFKVRPYGDEGSLYDWLELNERANKSPASVSHNSGTWRVLPYQLIGVVMISRERNAALYDMANREGLGAYEAAVPAPVSLCTGSAIVFQGSEKLLVRQAGGNRIGASADSGSVLYLQWCVWQISRLAEYRHLLCNRFSGFSL